VSLALHAPAQDGAPAIGTPPALSRSATPPHTVPAALSEFVGRARDLAGVGALLGRARLVTLAGPGGVGKTRLAREAAAREVAAHGAAGDGAGGPETAAAGGAPRFPDGVWWVELAPLPSAADPAPAVAAALGVRPPLGADRPDAIVDALAAALAGAAHAPRRLLVVLDNCEHVVNGAAALADLLLRRCPGLSLLATSREALGIEGETVWPVAGLAHPPADAGRGAAEAGAGPAVEPAPEAYATVVAGYEAATLFVERARAVQRGFALTARTAPHVAAICARLDGLPLAIELAAAQVATLGVEQLAMRLDDVFAVLTRGRRTALPRHRTLRALLDWSYHLLAPAERALLARLSVFRRPFTLEHAESVCAPSDLAERAGDVRAPELVAAFGRLVEQSLVDLREAGPAEGGEARYRLLEPVRQYAAALLAGTPDESRVRDRHLAWAAALAVRAEPALVSHERRAALRLLRQQLDDIRAAVRWAGEAPLDAGSEARARCALRIAGCLTYFWVSAGTWEDGWQLFEQALHAALNAGLVTPQGAAVEARPPDVPVVSDALWAGGAMGLLTGRLDRAAELASAAQAMLAAHHARTPAPSPERDEASRRLAVAHQTMFEVHAGRGDLVAARQTLDLAVATADASGDARTRLLARARGVVLQVQTGDLEGADAACAEAVSQWRALGDVTNLAATLQLAADVARERGDLRGAVAYAVESAAVFADEPDPWFMSRAPSSARRRAPRRPPRGSARASTTRRRLRPRRSSLPACSARPRRCGGVPASRWCTSTARPTRGPMPSRSHRSARRPSPPRTPTGSGSARRRPSRWRSRPPAGSTPGARMRDSRGTPRRPAAPAARRHRPGRSSASWCARRATRRPSPRSRSGCSARCWSRATAPRCHPPS
jgi:predicted ATPase